MTTLQIFDNFPFGDNLLIADRQPLTLETVIDRLAKMRTEWQEAAGGKNLTEVEGNAGLLLADVCDLLELTPEQRAAVLGPKLAEEAGRLQDGQ